MPHPPSSFRPPRERFTLEAAGTPHMALQVQRAARAEAPDVVYVHGATFGADLSFFFALDGTAWADAVNAGGCHAWGFDFVGFGASGRYPSGLTQPAGRIEEAMQDLQRVVAAVRDRNGGKPAALLAHSRGGAVATRYAAERPEHVRALVLFAPVVVRPSPPPTASPPLPSHYPLSAWAQYRRFIEDVPAGQPQVLAEAHMQVWAEQFLATDPGHATRHPPAVLVPSGPVADIAALWSGQRLYEPERVRAPTLLVRGEWDSLCTDADAQRLHSSLGGCLLRDVKIPRGTHLLHLEQQRTALHQSVNAFLRELLA